MNIKAIIGIVAALVVLVGGWSVIKPATPPLGAAGSDQLQFARFYDNISVGGKTFATTSQGSVTYTAASIANSRVIVHVASGALTATLPTNAALSAIGFLPNVGDTQSIYIYASTTLITLAGNTGMNLDSASTTNQINALGVGRLDFIRLPASENRDIEVMLLTGE